MDYPLAYEELQQLVHEPVPPFVSEDYDYMCEGHTEKGECPHQATVEWLMRDEDGGIFYSYRCDDHPVTDPDFEVHDL